VGQEIRRRGISAHRGCSEISAEPSLGRIGYADPNIRLSHIGVADKVPAAVLLTELVLLEALLH
jgi:hypothetical protein